jgi:hypothetical protein
MITKHRFASFTFVALIFGVFLCAGCGSKKPQVSAADQEKIAALNSALKSGVITQQEFDAKMKVINDLQSLDNACSSGALSANECAARRAAILNGPTPSTVAQAEVNQAALSAPADQGSAAPAETTSSLAQVNADASQVGAGGSVYSDPQGSFTVMIAQGWKATPQGQNGARGVQITQGRSWAVVAPFQNVSQPSDVVKSLAGQIQPQYKDFTLGQHGPLKFNGMDAELATFSGMNAQGAQVSMVIMGVAGPGGRMFAVMSSVPQGEEQSSNPAVSAMVQSIRFGGM